MGWMALPIAADVTRRDDVERVAHVALARFGGIDVWVNNAGRGISRRLRAVTDADIDEMMLVNVKSALYGAQVVLPHFRERGRGHIVNVSSMLGRVPFAAIRSAYSASKHALNSLMANLRMELAATHPEIHVTCVHPGIVATDFGKNAMHGGPDSRQLPGAQAGGRSGPGCIAECASIHPRADVYTRPGAQQMIVSYFAAEDMAEAEKQFGFGPPAATAVTLLSTPASTRRPRRCTGRIDSRG